MRIARAFSRTTWQRSVSLFLRPLSLFAVRSLIRILIQCRWCFLVLFASQDDHLRLPPLRSTRSLNTRSPPFSDSFAAASRRVLDLDVTERERHLASDLILIYHSFSCQAVFFPPTYYVCRHARLSFFRRSSGPFRSMST